MKYKTKSIIVGKKRKLFGKFGRVSLFISLSKVNNPHLTDKGFIDTLEYDKIHRVIIKDLDVNYLFPGNDIVVNDLEYVNINIDGQHIILSGKQKSKE